MKYYARRATTGRRLALEWCEPRRVLSTTTGSTDDFGEASFQLVAWQASFDLSYSTGLSNNAVVTASGFLPTPLGYGAVPIDAHTNLETLDTAVPPRYTNSGALNFATNDSFYSDFVFSDLLGGLGAVVNAVDFQNNFTDVIPAVVRERHASAPREPFADPEPDTSAMTPLLPTDQTGLPEEQASEPATASVIVPPGKSADDVGLQGGPALAPLRDFDATPATPDDGSVAVIESDDWLTFPGSGTVTDPVPSDEPTVGIAGGVGSSEELFLPSGDGDIVATETETRSEEPLAAEGDRETESGPNAVVGGRVVERLASQPAPPVGSEDLGAGTIDLTGLLFGEGAAGNAPNAAAVAQAPRAEDSEHAARDAALAVESWVRAIPSPASRAAANGASGPTEASTAKGAGDAVRHAQPFVGSVSISIDGDRLSAVEADSREQSSDEREIPELSTSAAVRIDRPSAYRYALSAVSILLGGAVFGVARRRDSDAGWGRRPAVAGRPRPGEPGREIKPSCE